MPDYWTPFTQGFNFVEGVKNKRAVIAEEQRQNRTLEDLRRQQLEQQFIGDLLDVMKSDNPAAGKIAEQIWNNTPGAVQRSGGPVEYVGKDAANKKMELFRNRQTGDIVGIDPFSGTARPIRDPQGGTVSGLEPVGSAGSMEVRREALELREKALEAQQAWRQRQQELGEQGLTQREKALEQQGQLQRERLQIERERTEIQRQRGGAGGANTSTQLNQLITRLQKTRDQLVKEKPSIFKDSKAWQKKLDALDKEIADATRKLAGTAGDKKQSILSELEEAGLFK